MQLPTVSRSHRDIKAEHENIHELAVFKPPSQHTHMFPSLLTSSISLYPSWTLELHPTLVVGRLKPSFNTTHIQCKQIGSEIANLAEGVGFMMSETAEIVMWSSYLNYLNRTLKSWSSQSFQKHIGKNGGVIDVLQENDLSKDKEKALGKLMKPRSVSCIWFLSFFF